MDQEEQPNRVATVEMPMQPSVPVQQTFQVPQTEYQSNQMHEIQAAMKRRIVKIIVAITIISAVGVMLALLISNIDDTSLEDRSSQENNRAQFEVPNEWRSESNGDSTSYFNAATPEGSQVSYVVSTPTKVSFSSTPLTEPEIIATLESFIENSDQLRDSSIDISDRSVLVTDDFNYAYEYAVTQIAEDGVTPVEGRLQVRFDDENYIHITEIAAIQNYWQNNAPSLINILSSYSLK